MNFINGKEVLDYLDITEGELLRLVKEGLFDAYNENKQRIGDYNIIENQFQLMPEYDLFLLKFAKGLNTDKNIYDSEIKQHEENNINPMSLEEIIEKYSPNTDWKFGFCVDSKNDTRNELIEYLKKSKYRMEEVSQLESEKEFISISDFHSKKAINDRKIDSIKLCHILSHDPQYFKNHLIAILKRFQFTDNEIKRICIDSSKKIIELWNTILHVIQAGEDIYGIKRRDIGDKLNLPESEIVCLETKNGKIELKELKAYFENHLKLPLPKKLFPIIKNKSKRNIRKIGKEINTEQSFTRIGIGWRVFYKGKETILENTVTIKYVLEALKNPEETIPYENLINIVSGKNKTNKNNYDYSKMSKESLLKEGLSPTNINKKIEESNYEMMFAFRALEKEYYKLKDGSPKDKKRLSIGIQHFKTTYKRDVYESKGELRLGRDLTKKNDSQRSLIGKARTKVLRTLKKELPDLHHHLETYLKMGNVISVNYNTHMATIKIPEI